jgi:hypothetical protein
MAGLRAVANGTGVYPPGANAPAVQCSCPRFLARLRCSSPGRRGEIPGAGESKTWPRLPCRQCDQACEALTCIDPISVLLDPPFYTLHSYQAVFSSGTTSTSLCRTIAHLAKAKQQRPEIHDTLIRRPRCRDSRPGTGSPGTRAYTSQHVYFCEEELLIREYHSERFLPVITVPTVVHRSREDSASVPLQ